MPVIILAAFGFPIGLFAGLSISWSPWVLAPLAALGAFVLVRGGPRAPPASAVLITAAAGIIWGSGARHARDADCRLRWRDGERITVVAEPRDLAPQGDAAQRPRRFDVREPERCAGPIMIQLPVADTTGQVLVVVGTWRRDPALQDARLPGRAERAGMLRALVVRPIATAPGMRARLRMGAERRLAVLFGPERWPLAAALTVSPEAGLPRELRQEFARAGLAHILSISGLHVGLLAGALLVVLQAMRMRPDAARAAGTLLVALYVWLLGFPAPALRSAGMLALWCWARVRQRPPVTGAILGTAILLVAVFDPWALFEPGPWLSFAGVWGCASAAHWWERVAREAKTSVRRRRLRRLAPVMVSVGAVLATTPIQVLVFETATPVALLANLIAIPVAAFATPALALVVLLGAVPGAMPAAAVTASAAGLALDALEIIAARAASLPAASVMVQAPLLVAVLSGAATLWLLRPGFSRRPARVVLAGRAAIAVLAMLAGAAWWPMAGSLAASDGDGRLALHFLSVGQGDATAIRTPRGRWILIDGGPRAPGMDAGRRRVLPFLRRHGARQLDLVVASHGDADHLGGLPAVMSAVPAAMVLEPGTPLGRPLYVEWLAGVARGRTRWHAARAGEVVMVDGVRLRVWHPDSGSLAAGLEPNENSVVLTVEYGKFRAAFGGDAGIPMERLRAAQVGRVAVLKVGHHGSRSASSEAWLRALRPALCVIEVGARNRYGHPDPGTVARLRDAGCGVWRTDRDGDVEVRTDGHAVQVSAGGRDTTFLVSKEHP